MKKIVIALAVASLAGCGSDKSDTPDPSVCDYAPQSMQPSLTSIPNPDAGAYFDSLSNPELSKNEFSQDVCFTIATSEGDITVALDQTNAPITTTNFAQYANSGFYEGTLIHRIEKDFVVQGGGLVSGLKLKDTEAPIENEANNGLKNERGTIAMARTSDPHSATSQFYFNTVDNPMLDYVSGDNWGYAVFGQIVQGIEVVDMLNTRSTYAVCGYRNVPVTPVTINSVTEVNCPQ
ncbi:peptidylprolyl isomerase [Paraferrimonas sedimenticola]|uniref:Peptidyl-prolyl cis-trans isomerase n=1 Tax=Paraferrimonas sedimenticola TaxID=375674 RepID=A0AA37VTP4_9GAMM|nr:peptidylprolyl isomerase [Paraferrimonas sedimenticola]GLP95469.1 peptidyl-prolyl cis-trans isomerase [Paraferrimonas sedimenticola]